MQFKTAKETEHIIPSLLKKVWEVDNDKERILWEMGQQGGVSGDVFVKVAWEPEWEDSVGNVHPGRVRILVLNPAYCFPEWHPHDRERLMRFKLKYRFWGTAPEGTRQVFTYTEILTDDWIEEYVNDELIDQRPNPLGLIPVTHISNIFISGSPWGLADVANIISLNREYNEKAAEISDILNYHAAPVTIITGGKATNLEKGYKKVWSLPNDKAKVFNLEGGFEALGPAMDFLERVKAAMHEMTGVPETALGQMQPISNTSGVALAIQYTPMMQRYHMKTMTYGHGLRKINEHILKTLFYFQPASVYYDPTTEGPLDDGQPPYVDPNDPLTYQTVIHWPPPLPVDTLIKLNEIQMKMALGLESKRGALGDLGEEFPDVKLQEIFEELVEDNKMQGALDMLKAQIQSIIMNTTGINPMDGQPPPPPPGQGGDQKTAADQQPPGPQPGPPASAKAPGFLDIEANEMNKMMADIVTQAYGTKFPMRRNPDNNE